MKRMRIVFGLLTILMIVSCGKAQKATFETSGANSFGAEISVDDAKDLAAYVDQINGEEELPVTVSGTINEVCQAKGCWMTLEDKNKEHSAFIKFKDYAFFVPKDAGGKQAVVKGNLYASLTPVDELRHYAEDKGATAEEIAAITEPEKELKMMVEGVVIYND